MISSLFSAKQTKHHDASADVGQHTKNIMQQQSLTVEEQFSINTVTGNRLEQVVVEHYYALD